MHAEDGLMLSFLQSFPMEQRTVGHKRPLLPLPEEEELISTFNISLPTDAFHLANLVQTSSISEYDLGGEGDLFKAPEPIIEEPVLALDPVTAAMSLISGGDDILAETIKVMEMESIQNERLLNEVFYDCKNELLAKSAIKHSGSELSDIMVSAVQREDKAIRLDVEGPMQKSVSAGCLSDIMVSAVQREDKAIRLDVEGPMQKSVSDGCLSSMNWINGCSVGTNFLDFQVDFGAAFRMRRAYSEGDIQTLRANNSSLGNTSMVPTSCEQQSTICNFKSEERRQKLSRYRKKKTKRNFARNIKYACRKALADSQPRVRGRFAKTEECKVSMSQQFL